MGLSFSEGDTQGSQTSLTQAFTSCVILRKLLNSSEPPLLIYFVESQLDKLWEIINTILIHGSNYYD